MTSPRSQASLEPGNTDKGTFSTTGERLDRMAFIAFLVCSLAWLGMLVQVLHPAGLSWMAIIALLLAAAMTILGLARTLPGQNVLMASSLAFLLSGLAQKSGAGPGVRIYDVAHWTAPLICVVVILNARGVARLILQPWREEKRYGFRVLALTWLLAVSLECGGAAGFSQAGMILATPMILIAITPWLINKRPGKEPAVDHHPLAIWWVLNVLAAMECMVHQRWPPAGLGILATVVATLFACRGRRRAPGGHPADN